MAESEKLADRETEQRERLISKAQEGLVETVAQPDGVGVSQPSPVKPGRFTNALVFAILACVVGSSFQFGFHIGATNTPGKVIAQWINDTHAQATEAKVTPETMDVFSGLINSLFTIGGMVGGMLVGTVADKFGRRQSLLYNNALAIIAALLMTLAKFAGNFYLFFVGRFVIGINAGFNSGLAPMYLVEISPSNLRGTIGSCPQLFVTISILVAQLMGIPQLLGTENAWPFIFAFTIVPVVFQLCTLPFCPESPKYTLIVKNRKDQAEKDLKKLRGDNDVHDELELLNAEAEAVRAQPRVSVGAMFRAPLLWPLWLAVFMMLSQQLSGINAAMFYSSRIFKGAGLSDNWVNIATIMMGTVNVLMTFVSVYMVERLGRRTLHLSGLAGTCVTTALIAISIMAAKKVEFFSYMSIIFVMLFVISFATGPGSIPWFYVSEVFPSSARGHANSIAVLTNWGSNTIVAFLFPLLNGMMGEWVFFLFTGMLVAFILFAYMYLPETKNKSLEDIQAEMDRLRGVDSGAATADTKVVTTPQEQE